MRVRLKRHRLGYRYGRFVIERCEDNVGVKRWDVIGNEGCVFEAAYLSDVRNWLARRRDSVTREEEA